MEFVMSWGSPVGLGLLFLLSGAGTGIFFWGLSHLTNSNKAK